MLDFSISLSATGRKKFWGMYSSKFIFLRNVCSRLFFLFWPLRCRQGKIVFLIFCAIFCVAVSRKIFWIVIWWVNIFFKKSDLFISSSVYFSLKRKGEKKRKQTGMIVHDGKLWRWFEIRNVIYRPQDSNSADDHFPVAKEWLILLRLNVLLNAKEKKETLTYPKRFPNDLQLDRKFLSSKAH